MTATAKPVQAVGAVPAARSASWRRTLDNALVITRREVRDSLRDWRITVPIVILTVFFPFLAQEVATRFNNYLAGFGAEIIGERNIPFLLMVIGFFPISISLVIALETFVGEKERRSLEPLLSTPLTNTELYIGKTLAAMIPPLLASYIGMGFYLLLALTGELQWRPPAMLIAQIVVLTTVQALVMVTGAVVVSSQTTSTRAANLLASFIIIPMAMLTTGESFIMFLAPDANSSSGIGALWAIAAGMAVVVVLLLRVGSSVFNREELLGRTIDELNLRGTLARLWRSVRAVDPALTPARSLGEWYKRGVWGSVRRLGLAVPTTVLVFAAALAAGYVVGIQPEWQLTLPEGSPDAATETFKTLLNVSNQTNTLLFIVWQNGRVLLAAALLSVFTFGTGALILTPAAYAILGYVLAQLALAGYNFSLFAAAVLTHGVVEIPVIVLATAAALRLGAVVTRPPRDTTVGQAWFLAFGDAAKIGLGLVLPGLVLAAFLEAFITPAVALTVLSAAGG
ncbi:MAG: stage II sporulation protein M [Aggregatilineales bacterium]